MGTLAEDLEFVKELAEEASEVARRRSAFITPQEKANLTYVTDLDHDLERLIRDRLAAQFPDDQLTGEEYEKAGGTGRRRWCIDPIDGTGNLVHALPLWSIAIGLLDDGEPVLGVIAVPPLGEMYWAVKGGGAWRDDELLVVKDASTIHNQDNICLGTNAMRAVDPRSIGGRLRDLGSACIELAFTAANRLAASAFLGEHAHDVAAGSIIAAEAGCGFARLGGPAIDAATFVRETPVPSPTFVAPPQRLEALLASARLLP